MLQLTPGAAHYVSDVRNQQGLPADAPLRISGEPSGGPLEQIHLGFVDAPVEGDQVDEVEGVAYCVSSDIAEATDSVMLDVDHSGDGPQFVLTDKA